MKPLPSLHPSPFLSFSLPLALFFSFIHLFHPQLISAFAFPHRPHPPPSPPLSYLFLPLPLSAYLQPSTHPPFPLYFLPPSPSLILPHRPFLPFPLAPYAHLAGHPLPSSSLILPSPHNFLLGIQPRRILHNADR